MPKTSILHISDLHRSKGTEISNPALLTSLINDQERYTSDETPRIKTPDLIIVSGDIIRGSTATTGSAAEVQGQYDEAIGFLDGLCKHFLSGDKDRIVLIPGNHDVDWRFSTESMTKLDPAVVMDPNNKVKADILKAAVNHNSNIRWSWRDASFYEITDADKYRRRLNAFSEFYSHFYEGKRTYPLDPNDQFDIFDFPKYNVTIAAFNSCYCNDHLRLAGDIHPNCMANATLALREYKRKGRLLLATWHHNTKGPPFDSNYMDASKLKNFINAGISLGFHGHQHKTELINEYSDVFAKKSIVVFSAGTLCGGPNELPPGNNRQYNLIELDENGDDKIGVTLHVRQKTDSSSFDNPIWTPGMIDSQLVSYFNMQIERPSRQPIESTLLEIEAIMKKGNYDTAKILLETHYRSNQIARKFLVKCIIETSDHELAFKALIPPETEEECLVLLNYAIQIGNKEQRNKCVAAIRLFKSEDLIIATQLRKLEVLINGK